MRASMLAIMILLLSVAPPVQADIVAACYTDCAAETDSNPDLKACLTRAANKADRLLNESYKTLQDAIRKSAQEMSQSPDEALASLTTVQNQWIGYRDANCAFEEVLPSAARRPAATIRAASAR